MLKATRENWREVFEDSKKNTTETLTFPGKSYSIAIFPPSLWNTDRRRIL